MRPFLPRCAAAARLALALTVALAVDGASALQVASIGLSSVRAQRFGNEDVGGVGPHDLDGFALTLAAGDFNGDGADDLATGIPGSDGFTADPVTSCGAVVVRFGIPGSGLDTDPVQTVLGQFTPDSPDPAEQGERFGSALVACDLNADGHDDLAVGIPSQTVNAQPEAGAIQVYYGSGGGFVAAPAFYRENTPGIPGVALEGDVFGFALACGDFDQDGHDDLAVGVPGKDFGGGVEAAGMVVVIPGGTGGLTPPATAFHQNTPLMLDDPETLDSFGGSLASGDFNADGYDDLAIGVFFESSPSVADSGAVQVVYGGASGLTATGNQLFFASSFGVLDQTAAGFARALAAGDFDGDGHDDLAIGHPGEFLQGPFDGAVTVVMGSGGTGLDPLPDRHRAIGAGLAGFPGDAGQHHKVFGWSLAGGDFDGDGHADLAIGVPLEDENGLADVGAETVLYGSIFADGFETAGTGEWSAAVP